MLKSVVLASVAVASLTVFATGASAQSINPMMGSGTTANEAFVIQQGAGSNIATINQSGSNNKAGKLTTDIDLSTPNLYADKFDSYTNGASTINQYGYHNTLEVTQGGSNNLIVTKTSNIGSQPNGLDPNGGSYQSGSDNIFRSTQNGTNGQVQFQQKGDRNEGYVNVYSGATTTYAGIGQNGNENVATINQYSNANTAFAAIVQNGNNNAGTIEQNGYVNYAALLQNGSGNQATISQGANYVGALGYQRGDGNIASISQVGSSANAAFAQIGNSNHVTITQR
ncbi:hypothetical protein [Methylobacterium oryzae]|uniref:hypothetical protein n=1 Tax=Methylobacterium oryzae TaxID=334852 RepID=UPI002F328DBA